MSAEAKHEKIDGGRRGFLKLAAMAAPATAAAAIAGTPAAATEAGTEAAAAGSAGLRKTPHVEAYLKAARF